MIDRDAFTEWLTTQRPESAPLPYQPMGFLGGPMIGWSIHIGRTHFVYRVPVEAPHMLYIVLIERGPNRRGLHSPFADMVRLLQMIQRSGAGITWIRGHVESSSDRPDDALSRERILAFYQRYLTTVSTGIENGIEWFGGDLSTFCWAREKRNIRHKGVSR